MCGRRGGRARWASLLDAVCGIAGRLFVALGLIFAGAHRPLLLGRSLHHGIWPAFLHFERLGWRVTLFRSRGFDRHRVWLLSAGLGGAVTSGPLVQLLGPHMAVAHTARIDTQ